ncbi:hypothetical protein SELMODRAFT_83579, partial [Selaginella moellendorffii]
LVKMYTRCGRLREAREVFDRIVICWNSMIATYPQGGHTAQARQLYEEMEGFELKASDTTFAGACSSLEEGIRGLTSSIIIQNALVSMYTRWTLRRPCLTRSRARAWSPGDRCLFSARRDQASTGVLQKDGGRAQRKSR